MRIRSFGSRALAIGIAAIAASGMSSSAGCSVTKPTELVPGALSQIEVPKNLAGLRVQVLANGEVKFDQNYKVVNGAAFLPATLGVVSGQSPETTVTVTIAGYDATGVAGPEFGGGAPMTAINATSTSPRVKRVSVQTYVDQHTLFLPMPLSYACWGTDCAYGGVADDNTCKGNTCTTSRTDPHTLVDFDPSLVDGTQQCFSPSTCFNPVTTAVLLDAGKCLYEVPPGEVAGLGLNVRVLYQDMKLVKLPQTGETIPEVVPTSEQEILNEESTATLMEGFAIPDPAKPQQFQLAPGLCKLVQRVTAPTTTLAAGTAYHTISAVQVSTTCPSKAPLLPICAAEQNPPTLVSDGGTTTNVVCNQPITLEPAPSALYIVMDDSSIMAGAYGAQGYATAMGLSLSNPVFKRTYVAFEFLDHKASDCTAASTQYSTPGGAGIPHSLEFTLANVAQPTIAGFLENPQPPDPGPDGGVPAGGFAPLYLQPAMAPTKVGSSVVPGGVYKHLNDFANGLNEPLQIGAAIFFLNRTPDSTGTGDAGALVPTGVDCSPALDSITNDTSATAAQTAIEEAIVEADTKGLQSYFVVLNNSLFMVGTPLGDFKTIQTAVKAKGVTTMQVIDATQPKSMASTVLASFSNIVSALGTCLYELPPGVDANAKMDFTIPIPTPISSTAPAPVPVKFNAQCSAATEATQNGWNVEGAPGMTQHIRICGTTGPSGSCWQLRQSVLAVSAVSLSGDAGTSAPVPEVPVTVTMPCTDAGAP